MPAGKVTKTRTAAGFDGRRRIAMLPAALASLFAIRALPAGAANARAPAPRLPTPASLTALLETGARETRPIVAMFSTRGCHWCEALRREQLNGLANEQGKRGVFVVEFDMLDERPFDRDADRAAAPAAAAAAAAGPTTGAGPGSAAGRGAAAGSTASGIATRAASPAALSRALGVAIAPTLVFLGPSGEIAPRLVGYASTDFYSAYLDDRIEQAKAALARSRR